MDKGKLPPLPGVLTTAQSENVSPPPQTPPLSGEEDWSSVPQFEPTLASVAEADALRDDPESGRVLAEHMYEAGYQPVILFGNAASGKTSLILSLLARVKTDTSLDTGLVPGSPILDVTKPYGAYLSQMASDFYGLKTQLFIDGIAAPKTNITLPFFIPLIFRPKDKPEAKLAFMESNGEWYATDPTNNKFFPPLKKQIEDFIRHYGKGIIFIHLLPYSQRPQYIAEQGGGGEGKQRQQASLAVSGALEAYDAIRPDRSSDQHLILVTKWDAHRSQDGEGDLIDDLHDDPASIRAFISQHYSQAWTSFLALRLSPHQMHRNGYCAGRIAGNEILACKPGDDLDPALKRYPVGLWRWLYQTTLTNNGATNPPDPFPSRRPGLFAWFWRLIDRFF